MESNYQSGDNFYDGFRLATTDMYDAMDILKLIDGSITLAETRGSKTHQGIFKVFRVLLFSFMTDFYGDVYYSEALKAREGILYPKYDKEQDIYTGLLAELDAASSLISGGTEEVSGSYDLMFAGDKTKWQKFANSLKLRLLMRASAKMTDAGAKIAAISGNVLSEATENASIAYVGVTAENSWTGGTVNWGSVDGIQQKKTM